MRYFVAYTSRWRTAWSLLSTLGFFVMGLWMVGAFGEVPSFQSHSPAFTITLGWVNLILWGLAAPIHAKRLFVGGVQLEVGPLGIRSTPWSDDLIPWSEISDVTTRSYMSQKEIMLHLSDPTRFPGRGLYGLFVRAFRRSNHGDVFISLNNTNRTYDEAMSAIEHFRNART